MQAEYAAKMHAHMTHYAMWLQHSQHSQQAKGTHAQLVSKE